MRCLSDLFHQRLRNFFLLFFRFRLDIVSPCIIVMQFLFSKDCKSFFGYHGNAEFYRVKHGIAIVLEKSAVVRQCHKTGNFPGMIPTFYHVPDVQSVVVRIHPVHTDLIRPLWECSLHQAHLVHVCPILKNPHGVSIAQSLFHIKQVIKLDAFLLNGLFLMFSQCRRCAEVSIFHMIFFKTFVVGQEHTIVCYQKSGNQSDSGCQQQKNHQIFSKFTFQLPWQPFEQWIFHQTASLPFQASSWNLLLIFIIFPNHAITKLHHSVRHIFDGIIVGHHDNGISIFLIDCFNQF